MNGISISRDEILGWLEESDPARLEELWARADDVRRRHVGDEVHLRGLVEISNHCVRSCTYCGLRAPNRELARYRMEPDEILGCAREAKRLGYGTVVLQSGEDPALTRAEISGLVRLIKIETGLAVTLSLGERSDEDLAAWREAGADRYLLRFETSDRALFDRIHPALPGRASDRVALLRRIAAMGYEAGGGVMIGIPGQTLASLADDIELFRALDLDMIGVGPFIPHPGTPLGGGGEEGEDPDSFLALAHSRRTSCAAPRPRTDLVTSCHGPSSESARAWNGSGSEEGMNKNDEGLNPVPASEEMVYKVIALARLVRPDANIPATTALATINPANGRERGLARGANVVMPNLTPVAYRRMYEIYPKKACIDERPSDCAECLAGRILGMGRTIGAGPGGRGDGPDRSRPLVDANQATETRRL